MRIKVRCLGTRKRNADGTLGAPAESKEQLAEMSVLAEIQCEDRQVSEALSHYEEHRDLEPLLELLLEANAGILRNATALALLAGAARGELRKGRGRIKIAESVDRDRRIAACAYWLNKTGMPIKNAQDKNRNGTSQAESACRAIGSRLCISEDAVYSVVRRVTYSPSSFEILPWLWTRESPTPTQLIKHYFPDVSEPIE